MIENIGCMRDIVEFVSKNVKVVVERDNKFRLETTSLYKVIETLSKEKGYEKETIISNFLLCCKYHYIESDTYTNNLSNATSFSSCKVTDITPQGIQFLHK